MALWQISFSLLPKSLVTGLDEVPSDLFERYEDDVVVAAPEFLLPADHERSVERLLPRTKSWHADIELWGGEGSNDFCICRDAGRVVSITARIDARKLDDSLISGLLDLADRGAVCLLSGGIVECVEWMPVNSEHCFADIHTVVRSAIRMRGFPCSPRKCEEMKRKAADRLRPT